MLNHGSRKRDISVIRKSLHRGQARAPAAPTLSVEDANLEQLFYALLDDQDDEDLQEVLQDFLVQADRTDPVAGSGTKQQQWQQSAGLERRFGNKVDGNQDDARWLDSLLNPRLSNSVEQ